MCGPGISRIARLISGMVSTPIGFAMSAPASMNSWQRSMASSTEVTPAASVRAAMNRSGSRRASSAAFTLASICSVGDHLLARQVAAAVREHLVGEEQAGDAGILERAHHLPHIVDAAEAGVGIDIDRHVHRRADAARSGRHSRACWTGPCRAAPAGCRPRHSRRRRPPRSLPPRSRAPTARRSSPASAPASCRT